MSDPNDPAASDAGPHADQPLLTAGAPAVAAEAALVPVHGRGATAQGVVNLLEPALRRGVTVVAPRALRNSWYPRPASAPRAENEPWLSSSVERVGAALESIAEIGVPSERTVLGGFSQGSTVAAEFVRRRPARYGGVFLLSGTLPGASDPTIGGRLEGTPVFVGRGAADTRIDHDRVDETVRAFDRAGADVVDRRYPNVGHEVTADEFERVGALLEAALAD